MLQVRLELESILKDINQAAQKADSILELSRAGMKYPVDLDMILLDIITELYLMKTPIIHLIGSMGSTQK